MTNAAVASSDIKLRFAYPSDFAALRSLRDAVFRDELGIQERSYHDVISDWHSKNIVLIAGERLIGAVRLAYIRELQEYYVSYLCLTEEYRRKAHLRLLFGALLLLMKRNEIRSIRADSSDANLNMYKAMGCVPVGAKFRKPGFVCEWTPMRYWLGVNAARERSLSERAAAHFERCAEGDLIWAFDTAFHICSSMSAYQTIFEDLLERGLIPGHVPHLTLSTRLVDLPHNEAFIPEPKTIEVRSDKVEFMPEASTKSITGPSYLDDSTVALNSRFSHLNALIAASNLLIILVESEALGLARLYAILTNKHLVELNSWDELSQLCRPAVVSATVVIGPTDLAPSHTVLSAVLRSCAIGVLTAADLPALSSKILGSYFHFIGPTKCAVAVSKLDTGSCHAVSGVHFALTPLMSGLVFRQELAIIVFGTYHLVIVPARTCRSALVRIAASLNAGCTIGQSVRLASAEIGYNEPMMLIGDPTLRLVLVRSERNAEETQKLAAVSE